MNDNSGSDNSGRDLPAMLEALGGLHPKSVDLSLSRIRDLLDRLGTPQDRLDGVIHVAGTNGKGSVIAFLRSVLEAGGYRVQVYTSPHLVRFNERIRLWSPSQGGEGSSVPVSDAALAAAISRVAAANAGDPITFFEITTAIAFELFARDPADFCLLEVGLGGRLDATNVVKRPIATVFTPIALDHEDYLGSNLLGIAAEKAGILRAGVPAVIGAQDDHVRAMLEVECQAQEAPAFVHGQDWTVCEDNGRLVFQDGSALLDLPLPRLAGGHQIANAGLAIATLRAAGIDLGAPALDLGIRTARWPARLQRLRDGALFDRAPIGTEIWVDAGHNPAAADVMAKAMGDLEERTPRPLVLITGLAETKNSLEFFRAFDGLARHVWTVPLAGGFDPEVLAERAMEANLPAFAASDLGTAFAGLSDHFANSGAPRVLICGSHILAGAALSANGTSAD